MTFGLKTGLLGVTALAAALGAAGPADAQETLRFSGFGGSWAKHVVTAWIEPFQKETGIKVVYDTWDLKIGKVRAMVEAKNITTDVFIGNPQDALAGCDEGILEKIDHKVIGDPKAYPPGANTPCGVSSHVWVSLFVWSKDRVPVGPKNLKEAFDTKKIPGKRALSARGYGIPELVLMADGVAKEKVYEALAAPGGYDRVFAYLTPIKKDIVWWAASSAQALQLLMDGEVNFSAMPGNRYYDAASGGKNVDALWNGTYYSYDTWFIPKGAPNKATAEKFLAYVFQPERSAAMTNLTTFAPAHKDAVKFVKPELSPFLPMGKNLDGGVSLDFQFWAERLDGFLKQFEAWKQQ